MRAIFNIGFQFTLACALLVCITCNRLDNNITSIDEGVKITKKDQDFVAGQIEATAKLIDLAEIGERKGNRETSSRASALKDNQVAALYHWIDYARKMEIEIPVVNQDTVASKLIV